MSGKPQFLEDSAVAAFAQVIPTLPVRILKKVLPVVVPVQRQGGTQKSKEK